MINIDDESRQVASEEEKIEEIKTEVSIGVMKEENSPNAPSS